MTEPESKKTRVETLDELLRISEESPSDSFASVMEVLLNRVHLVINGVKYRVVELEMYCLSNKHNDVFTHGDPVQKQNLTWYFHKSGKGYKGGTYKGLDLALGSATRFTGVLIRSIESLSEPGSVISGPCLCVNEILRVCGAKDIAAFVASNGIKAIGNKALCLELSDDLARRDVIQTVRIGLSLKTKSTEKDVQWWGKKYRYLTVAKLSKGKNLTLIALIEGGKSVEEAGKQVTTTVTAERYHAMYVGGKKKTVKSFLGKGLDITSQCQLLGAISNKKW